VENFTKAVDINTKSRQIQMDSRLPGVVYLLNPRRPNPSNTGLDRFVSWGYELLVKQLEFIKKLSFACTHVHLTINV
jgi:hypothetical protein